MQIDLTKPMTSSYDDDIADLLLLGFSISYLIGPTVLYLAI